MKKVLFTATVDSHILAFHLPFLKWFKEQGYEVHVATNGDMEIPYCDKKNKISFERSPFRLNNVRAISQLRKVLEEEKYDIIHTHTPMGATVTRLAAKRVRKVGTRVIYTAHGLHFYKGSPLINWLLFYPVEKYLSRYTDTLILINQEDFELAKRKFKKCSEIHYIPGVGIDENKFSISIDKAEKKLLLESLGLTEEDFILFYPAELNRNKNQVFLIHVMEELVKEHSNIHLLLAGKDSYHGFYQQLVKEKKLEKNIHFLGFRKDIPQLQQISSVAVASSKREGLPVNIMESMIAGLPIVALDCRGTRDLIQDQENGYLVEQNNLSKFISRIDYLYYNKDAYDQFSINNRNRIEEYLLSNILPKMVSIYNKKEKVIHLLSTQQFSGAENVACSIIQATTDEYETFYCSPEGNGNIKQILDDKKINFIQLRKMSIGSINRIIRLYRPDIIHAHDFKASCLTTFSCFRGKLISHLHQNPTWIHSNNLKTRIYQFCSKRICRIIVVSQAILDEFYFKEDVKNKTEVIYNYVDQANILAMGNENYNEHFDLCYFGRLATEKDPLLFIDIVNTYKNKYQSNVKACMIGTGALLAECNEKIERLNLTNHITMLGFCKNPYKIVKNCSCVVMPSKYEGFGLTAIESLILNVPVFSSGVGGLKEIFRNHPELICSSVEEYTDKIHRYDFSSSIPYTEIHDYTSWKKALLNIYNKD